MRIFILAVGVAVVIVFGAWAFTGQPMMINGSKGIPTSVAPLSANVADNAASGTTVASLSCTTSDGSNTGCTFGVTDPQGYLKVVGSTLETTGTVMTDGTYSNILLQATKNGVTYPAAANFALTVTASGSIACAIGPSFTGSVPAGAHAAHFDTCAANYDFTNPALASLSSWLDCAGAATPILFNQPGAGGNGSDCSATSMVSDGGLNAVQLRIPSGTLGRKYAVFSTVSPDLTQGQAFPQTRYIEYSYRSPTPNACSTSPGCDAMQFFSYSLTTPPAHTYAFEWDFTEVYILSTRGENTGATGAIPSPGVSLSLHSPFVEYNANGTSFTGTTVFIADQTAWHTYALRVVSDGAGALNGSTNGNVSWCFYIDGTQKICAAGQYTNPSDSITDAFQLRELITYQDVIPDGLTLSGNQDFHLRYIRVWECSNWQAATGVTQSGNNCLNTTADVTGPLAGAP